MSDELQGMKIAIRLVSSREGDGLPAFCAKLVGELADGAHRVHVEGAVA